MNGQTITKGFKWNTPSTRHGIAEVDLAGSPRPLKQVIKCLKLLFTRIDSKRTLISVLVGRCPIPGQFLVLDESSCSSRIALDADYRNEPSLVAIHGGE